MINFTYILIQKLKKTASCDTIYDVDAKLCNQIFIGEIAILKLLYGDNECVGQ